MVECLRNRYTLGRNRASGCNRGGCLLILRVFHHHSQRLFPSQPLSYRRTRAPDPPSERLSSGRFAAGSLRVSAPRGRSADADAPEEEPRPSQPRVAKAGSEACLFRLCVEGPQGPARPRPCRRPGARSRADARGRRRLQEAMTPRFKTDANGAQVPDVRAAAAIVFNPDDRPGPLAGERAGQALDRQHHQGDDRAGLPRRQPGPRRRKSPSSAATSTPPRRPISAPTSGSRSTTLLHLTLIPSDNAAARALARAVARRHGVVRRADEREGDRARAREHDASRIPSGLNPANMSSAYDLSRLISFASSDERIASIMRTQHYTVDDQPPHDPRSTAPTSCSMDGDVDVMAGKTGFITQGGLLPGDAAAPAAGQADRRGRRPRREVEQRPLLGDAPPVQLAEHEGGGSVRKEQTAASSSSSAQAASRLPQLDRTPTMSSARRRHRRGPTRRQSRH